MSFDIETQARALAAAAGAPAIRIGARRIEAGDENALLPAEAAGMPGPRAARRASGAARIVARRLFGEIGRDPQTPVLRSAGGAPLWPGGLIGSLSHDDAYALAAIAPASEIRSLGVDIEPALPLPEDLWALVLSPSERAKAQGDPLAGRKIFSAKESVYKAVYAADGLELDYLDIEISLAEGLGVLSDGRRLAVTVIAGLAVMTMGILPASPRVSVTLGG